MSGPGEMPPTVPAPNLLAALVGHERREAGAQPRSLRPRLPYAFAPLAVPDRLDFESATSVEAELTGPTRHAAPPVGRNIAPSAETAAHPQPDAPVYLHPVPDRKTQGETGTAVPPTSGGGVLPAPGGGERGQTTPAKAAPNLAFDGSHVPVVTPARSVARPRALAEPMPAGRASREAPATRENASNMRYGDRGAPLRVASRLPAVMPRLEPAHSEPVVEISIGRIDIRAASRAEPTVAPSPQATRPHDEGLSAYLGRRSRGARS